ncbi:MAG: hypothetical protein O3A00_08510 [Planctomycetota bacterium]|nr:hypothetical protein [Planctomycetota bacterium]
MTSLPQSLLTCVERHACFAGCFRGSRAERLVLNSTQPPERGVVIQCEGCLSFYVSTLDSLLPANMHEYRLAESLSQHVQQLRGVTAATGGYHVEASGFWLNAAYFAQGGFFLLDGKSSRNRGSDLDLLMLALNHGVLSVSEPGIDDPANYAVQTIAMDRKSGPTGQVTSVADLLAAPYVSTSPTKPPGWQNVTLAEFLPVSTIAPSPSASLSAAATTAPARSSAAGDPSGATVADPTHGPLKIGDVCPNCGAEFRERTLLNDTYVGCLC